ncbi:hypothetical protein [Paractinoplanes atraurantiacus]|uniref:hypothetical protein n=1 Tax=Paractinoplanes atraurantiacus TaxID=1036182 RepID=UPI0011775CC6|nr:hypothetical protein [Actinoplanes atraurantiacus]
MTHIPMAYAGVRTDNLTLLGVVLAMTAGCVPCALHLWRGPSRATWCLTAAMTAAMLALHGSLMSVAGHHHGTGATAYSMIPALALLLLSVTCTIMLMTGSVRQERRCAVRSKWPSWQWSPPW